MAVEVHLVDEKTLSFPAANAVEIAPGGHLRVIRTGNNALDASLGGVAWGQWRDYSIDPPQEDPA